MISYPVTNDELLAIIEKRLSTTRNLDGTVRKGGKVAWLTRAAQQIERLRTDGRYSADEQDEFWHELKAIFAQLQGEGKCGFCERKLPVRGGGSIDGDIEHYRPKNGVKDYLLEYTLASGGNAPNHYFWLAYVPRNYLLACRVCNQDFKRNFFPIAGRRCPPNTTGSALLRAELPYLLHPLDPDEPDPEALIEFLGSIPRPRVTSSAPGYWRAIVTIDLLGLTGARRNDLNRERAEVITSIYLALSLRSQDVMDPLADGIIRSVGQDTAPHRNCARSFMRLCESDPILAKRIAAEAIALTI